MKKIVPYLFITIIFFSFACKKKKEEKISGNWEYVYLENVNNSKQIWTFNNDKSLIRTTITDTSITDTSNWKIEANALSKPNLTISNLNNEYNGTYEVLTLNKKFLIIERIMLTDGTTGGAFMRHEFVKSK